MSVAKYFAFFGVSALCACGTAEPKFRSFDIALGHPSQKSTYISVTPGSPMADLPRVRHLKSNDFGEFLRAKTGCVIDGTRSTYVLGRKRTPAGYMVPIICI